MPVMLVQAIIIAATLCVCELVCSPIYLSFTPGLFPIGSWVLVAMLLAVAFAYVVGFALLWCAESFAYRMKRKLQPVVYSLIGAVGFAVHHLGRARIHEHDRGAGARPNRVAP